jgi:hypothetical protein
MNLVMRSRLTPWNETKKEKEKFSIKNDNL